MAITFLGHKIDQHGVFPDPERVAAISEFPAPWDRKQLRQLCNFHHRFILNYVSSLAPAFEKRDYVEMDL
jgi:hypothetical protein